MNFAMKSSSFLPAKILILLAVSVSLFITGPAFGDSAESSEEYRRDASAGDVGAAEDSVPVSADEFQMAILSFMYRMQDDAAGTELGVEAGMLADRIMGLDSGQLDAWLNAMPDPGSFVSLLNTESSREPGIAKLDRAVTLASGSRTVLQHLGPLDELGNAPDYPPDSGPYGEWLIQQLQDLNLLPLVRAEAQRCEVNGWARFFKMWDRAKAASDDLELLCVSTNGDPTGFVNGPACGLYSVALGATSLLEVPLRECDAHIGSVDSAEIQAAYKNTNRLVRNTAHIHHDIEVVDGSLDAMETDIEEVLQETLAIRSDINTHDLNIDGDLASHHTKIDHLIAVHGQNMVDRLTSHDDRLVDHDANIDADLAKHDADNKARLIWMQHTLDQKIELRRVHLQVVEVKNRDEYLVMTTESGRSVNVSFESIETFDSKADEFLILDESTVEHIEAGVYLVNLQPQPDSNGKIFRFKVRHGGSEVHFGQIVFHAEMRSASN